MLDAAVSCGGLLAVGTFICHTEYEGLLEGGVVNSSVPGGTDFYYVPYRILKLGPGSSNQYKLCTRYVLDPNSGALFRMPRPPTPPRLASGGAPEAPP